MGQEGIAVSRSYGCLATGKNGHALVSGMGPAIRIGDTVHTGEVALQGCNVLGTVPIHHSDLQHTEDSPVRGDGMTWVCPKCGMVIYIDRIVACPKCFIKLEARE